MKRRAVITEEPRIGCVVRNVGSIVFVLVLVKKSFFARNVVN